MSYGFDTPFLEIEFDYKNGKEAEVVPYRLRISKQEEEYLATVNDEGIVYRILDLPFLHIKYEDLVLRWFVSPFISEVAALSVAMDGQETRYEISGENVKDISVTRDGEPVADELFRSYYNLVTSAAFDGEMLPQEPELSGTDTPRLCRSQRPLPFHDAGEFPYGAGGGRRSAFARGNVCHGLVDGDSGKMPGSGG